MLDSARIIDFHIVQRHENDRVFLTPNVTTDKQSEVTVTVTTPEGHIYEFAANGKTEINNPQLCVAG